MQDLGCEHPVQEIISGSAIGHLTTGQQERDRATADVGQRMDFGRASAARATDRLVAFPLYGMARPSSPPCPGRRMEDAAMDIHVLGIDLGKNSCSVVGLDRTGRVVLRRRMRRGRRWGRSAELSGCVGGMGGGGGGHHPRRLLGAPGGEGRVMLPEYVRPYVQGQKKDD